MGLISLLKMKSRYFYLAMILLGLSDAVMNIALLLFINKVISREGMPSFFGIPPVWIYIAILPGSILVSNLFQRYIIRLTNELRFEMELNILDKLKRASFDRFEKLGNEKVFTAMGDARELADLPEVFMNTFNAVVTVVCCLGYLFITSWIGGLIVLGIMAVLLVVYLARNVRAEKDLNQLRDLQNEYFIYLNDLLYGYKELKMGTEKMESIFKDFFYPNRKKGKALAMRVGIRYMSNELTGKYSWYIVLGAILFLLPPVFHFQSGQLLAFITTILYLIGPVAVLITLMPILTRVKIAVARLSKYEDMIQADPAPVNAALNVKPVIGEVKRIIFEGVAYDYMDEKRQKKFSLGPINVEIGKGELIFITGGNGSGKSTFVNLLTGLYQPGEGKIWLEKEDGEVITGDAIGYKEHMAAIFTTPYLFRENYYGLQISEDNPRYNELAELMQLSGIVRIDDRKQIADSNLSKGQQKRLAMIYALMEDRPVLILDEWAAEQDPEFRAYFYRVFLPELIRKGKTVIAITHDDIYFPCADRIIKFDFGRITSMAGSEMAFEFK